MISLGILTSGFLGIFALLSQSLSINRVTADDLTATYLAAEGVELAKNIIDHDVYAHLATPPQGAGWDSSFGGGGAFELDSASCTTGGGPCVVAFSGRTLRYDPATHLYGYANTVGSVATTYVRRINITVPNANEIVANSVVTGPVSGGSVNLEDHFYNWHP